MAIFVSKGGDHHEQLRIFNHAIVLEYALKTSILKCFSGANPY